uniref:Glycosyl transferase n=1 Tax=Anisakis simplex TaxID=6269 RepID=A0A0M3JL76_ANISI
LGLGTNRASLDRWTKADDLNRYVDGWMNVDVDAWILSCKIRKKLSGWMDIELQDR